MAGITLAQAEAELTKWLAADAKVSTGQQWSSGGETYTRADADSIRENIKFWNDMCKELGSTRTGISVTGATPSYDR